MASTSSSSSVVRQRAAASSASSAQQQPQLLQEEAEEQEQLIPKQEQGQEQEQSAVAPRSSALYQALTSTANLANLLPTGTLLAFNLLAPTFTNHGACDATTALLTRGLLAVLALSCILASFTDSVKGADGRVYYGVATPRGIWLLDYPPGAPPPMPVDKLARYRLAFVDFVHAALSAAVFGVVAARDKNVVRCLCGPAPGKETEEVLDILPLGVGVVCSLLFVAFPTRRHGIGYPVSKVVLHGQIIFKERFILITRTGKRKKGKTKSDSSEANPPDSPFPISTTLLLSLRLRQTKSHNSVTSPRHPVDPSHRIPSHPIPSPPFPWQPTSPSHRRLDNKLPPPANSSFTLLHRRRLLLFFVVAAVRRSPSFFSLPCGEIESSPVRQRFWTPQPSLLWLESVAGTMDWSFVKLRCTRGRGLFPLYLYAMFGLMAQLGACSVVLMADNTTLSFDDVEATFTPAVEGTGVNGVIYAVEPLDACSPLRTKANDSSTTPFALVVRGGCQFDDKVRNVQKAGFRAAVVYDNEDSGVLVSMAGSSSGIHIYAVFISKASGEVLQKYSGQSEAELWIIPTYENSAWSIMAISFISLLAMSAVLATCFFLRRHQIRRDRARIPRSREFHGMSSQLVKAMPSLIFTKVQEDNCTSSTCAICLEDYSIGEKLRVLPCRHKFHAACVDLWLTSWRTFCPVCKRDANTGTSNPPVSESTPLLSSAVRLPAGSAALASFQSTVAASPPRPISRHPSSHSMSRTYSIAGIPCTPNNPHRSSANSPSISTSGSSVDLANMSSPLSRSSHLASAHSLCAGHLSPPINIRYASHVSRSGYGSSSQYLRSSHMSYSGHGYPSPVSFRHHHPYLRHCTFSGPSLLSMVPHSPQETVLQHGGSSETNLSAAASPQSFHQFYLQRCPDSDVSSQSLPGC